MNNALGRREWTQEEDERILSHSVSDTILGGELGVPHYVIKYRRKKLKAGNNVTTGRWSQSEIELLFMGGLTDREISEKTGRSLKAIYNKRWKMAKTSTVPNKSTRGGLFWTRADDCLIRNDQLSDLEIARLTGKTEQQVAERRSLLARGLYSQEPWTKEEDELVISSEYSDDVISKQTGRNESSIRRRRKMLNGKQARQSPPSKNNLSTRFRYGKRPWTPEEEKIVLEHEISDFEISKKIERSMPAIVNRRMYLRKNNKSDDHD